MPRNRLQRSLRITFVGLIVNALLAAAKLTAGILGNSYALIADAVESLADVFSSIIVWRGVVVAAVPADDDHPYGHGKAEPIAAAIVAGMLLFASIGITIQAVQDLLAPRQSPAPFTLVVLLAVIVIKEALFRLVFREGTKLDSSVVQTDAWHHRSDAITSLAAAIGIAIAIIGGPGYERADSIAAILAAGIIAFNGWRLLRPAVDELMDTAPDQELHAKIERIASGVPDVQAVEKCFVRKMGYHFFVDMHIEVNPAMTVQQAHDVAHAVKDEIRAQVTNVSDVLVHIEPGKG